MMYSNKRDYESIPKKLLGAGCLLFDGMDRLLLVKSTYKPTWEIPGGIVEQDESTKQCCQREIHEEIGLIRNIGNLLVVDYNQPREWKTE